MFWNETRAKTEICAILHENMQVKSNSRFYECWEDDCNQKELHFRGIIVDTFLASQKAQKTWYGDPDRMRLKHWEARTVPNDVFPITHGTIVYDNVVAYYHWKDDEIFGIEIYNADIADAQRQFYELLWQKGQPQKG